MLDDAESERLAQVSRLVAGYREAARRALDFARRYRDDEGVPGGARERACIVQAMAWRKAAHDVRAGRPVSMVARPGLARARGEATAQSNEPSTTNRAAG
jgi:hypothetical protein